MYVALFDLFVGSGSLMGVTHIVVFSVRVADNATLMGVVFAEER